MNKYIHISLVSSLFIVIFAISEGIQKPLLTSGLIEFNKMIRYEALTMLPMILVLLLVSAVYTISKELEPYIIKIGEINDDFKCNRMAVYDSYSNGSIN